MDTEPREEADWGNAPPMKNVIKDLKRQHNEIYRLLDEVKGLHGEEKQNAFDQLRRLIAQHETAEELVVHPEARDSLKGGDKLTTLRLDEESQLKNLIRNLEMWDVDGQEFDILLCKLDWAMREHNKAEERDEFPRLERCLSPTKLRSMSQQLASEERSASTHPLPDAEELAESTKGALADIDTLNGPLSGPMLRPLGSLMDAIRGAVTGTMLSDA